MDLGEKEHKEARGLNLDPILAIATQPKSTQATH